MIGEVDDNQMDILLGLSLKPVVFKFLFEGYPGKDELLTRLRFKGTLLQTSLMFTPPED